MADERENVVRAIRESLPEFAERNGAELSETQMDNLAYWVAGVVPSDRFRAACPGQRIAESDGEPVGCACPGFCQRWVRIDPETADRLTAASHDDDAASLPTGGSWSSGR